MLEHIKQLKKDISKMLNECNDINELNEIKNKYLGKKGEIAGLMVKLKEADSETKKELGKTINELKNTVTLQFEEVKLKIEKELLNKKLTSEVIDISLPSYDLPNGNLHPLTQTENSLVDFFIKMGYQVGSGPEIESDLYNFEMLNIPKDHPAREMQDTLYFDENLLLRSQTSPMQVREMLKAEGVAPVKIIAPGKVYRRDDDDATHSHQFMQMEVLHVDKNINFSDLKGILYSFLKYYFGENVEMRLRPSYFPFTEPSVEVDVSCACGGKKDNCSICRGSGWLEVLGAGMVHPNVLKGAGFDPNIYSGFALGVGIERLCMLRYGINDIRAFYTNDVRLLKQFKRFD